MNVAGKYLQAHISEEKKLKGCNNIAFNAQAMVCCLCDFVADSEVLIAKLAQVMEIVKLSSDDFAKLDKLKMKVYIL